MASRHQVERVCDLADAYVQAQGNDARVVGGDVGNEPHTSVQLDFDNPVNVDTGHMSEHLGMPVTRSDDGRSLTFHKP